MHRTSKKRCRASGFGFRLLWIIGYLGVTLAAALSMFLLPALISKFKLNTINADSYPFHTENDASEDDGFIRLQQMPSYSPQNVHHGDRKEVSDFEKLDSLDYLVNGGGT